MMNRRLVQGGLAGLVLLISGGVQANDQVVLIGGVTPARINVDVTFYPFNQYAPADNSRHRVESLNNRSFIHEGGLVRNALEEKVADQCTPSVQILRETVENALKEKATEGGVAVLISELGNTFMDKDTFFAKIGSMPYLEKRKTSIAIYFDAAGVKTTYEGKLVNGEPAKKESEKSLLEFLSFSDIRKSARTIGASTEERIKNTQPLTFDGVAKLTYTSKYRVFDTATGRELRAGTIGPVVAISEPFQASWQLPGSSSQRVDKDFSIYQKYINDPRDTVLPEAIRTLATMVKVEVGKSFGDWSQLIDASKELRATTR